MTHSFPKQSFLDDLFARNAANLTLVREIFAPLERAARSTQPAPNEWCVDQCFHHLVVVYEMHLRQFAEVSRNGPGRGSAAEFRRSWMARRDFYRRVSRPTEKVKTLPMMVPSEHYYPDVFDRFLAQKEHMSEVLGEAASADLQARCWWLKVVPINFGDFLELLVMHDELHIDQAQRALSAYRQVASA